MGDDGIVALLPVRSVELLGPVDLHPVLQAVLVADVAVDNEFCRIVPAKMKVGERSWVKKFGRLREGRSILWKPLASRLEKLSSLRRQVEQRAAKSQLFGQIRLAGL